MGKISKNKILVDLINNQKNEVQDNKKVRREKFTKNK